MTQTVQAQIAYFGKIPSRGDFVKSAHNPQLLATLDRWIAEAMELLTDDPRWKIVYENAKPMHFAFLGSRSRLAIAGHMVASQDQSSRRFPFLAATALEVEKPLTFLAHSPLAFARLWSRIASQMKPPPISIGTCVSPSACNAPAGSLTPSSGFICEAMRDHRRAKASGLCARNVSGFSTSSAVAARNGKRRDD